MNNLQKGTSDTQTTRFYVTLRGLPLSITLLWPFRPSGSGADWQVLHTDVRLENGEGRHALVSINLTQVLREKLGSLEPKDCEGQIINALRKETDVKQLEFVKSAKLVPLPFSSRHYDMRRECWTFQHANEQELGDFIRRKVYCDHKLAAHPPLAGTSQAGKSWLTDPVDLMYLDVGEGQVMEAAGKLAAEGLLQLRDNFATPTEKLLTQAAAIEAEMDSALKELDSKHAFERAL